MTFNHANFNGFSSSIYLIPAHRLTCKLEIKKCYSQHIFIYLTTIFMVKRLIITLKILRGFKIHILNAFYPCNFSSKRSSEIFKIYHVGRIRFFIIKTPQKNGRLSKFHQSHKFHQQQNHSLRLKLSSIEKFFQRFSYNKTL